jgi:SAM-dependent methyltransferase
VNEQTFEPQKATTSRDVLGFYDRYAESWDERFGNVESTTLFHRMRLESLLHLARFRPSDRAVELGVGTGPYVDRIAPLVASLRCVDGAPGMLDVLKRKHSHLNNVDVALIDLERPLAQALPDADIVYMFGLLEHILDVPTFVANCAGLLKVGGRLVLVAPNGRSPWYGAMRRLCRAGAHCSSDRYYTPEQCDTVFSRAGFAREGLQYWGYAPAGVPRPVYNVLTWIGRLADRTPIRRYAGGMTVSYVLVGPGAAKARQST